MALEVSFNLAAAALYPGVVVNLAFTHAVYHYHYCESRTNRSSTATKKDRKKGGSGREGQSEQALNTFYPHPCFFGLPPHDSASKAKPVRDRTKERHASVVASTGIAARSTLPDESCASEDLHAMIQYISCLTKGCKCV
jgi:hypothetical protein